MRGVFIGATLLLLAWPRSGHAQEAPDEFEEAARALGTPSPAPQALWVLDDDEDVETVPWDDFDVSRDYLPRGTVSFGLEARVGAIPTEHIQTSPRPYFDVGAFVDLRYSSRSPWRMRIGVAVSAETFSSTNLGGGTFVTSSVFAVRLRWLPLSVDLGRNMGIRMGPDIGIQYAPSPGGGRVLFYGAGVLQLVGRSDDGRLEIGAYGGLQLTGLDRLERSNSLLYDSPGGETYLPDATLGLSAGYQF